MFDREFIDWGQVAGAIAGLIALAALVAGMAWMVHSDIHGPCTHTLAGERCYVVDSSVQR